ncbi:hypothetical protein B7P43_G17757 [Cryptotermes secundus]|uniref:DDE Tnp4 domain-containing protein n=1 Tax=Cryptotermes secundus TaxID=105785 RepID=A0A2J7PNP4_9NEOP|nr:hypothetical protein B7P43_G17757 [Cryptotermes secundus]
MRSECIPVPTKEKWKSIASGIERNANFPNCIGAVDGKHIRIICPDESGFMYWNYNDYYTVVLMAVADSKFRFVHVNIGSFGKDCNSTILKRSALLPALMIYLNRKFVRDGGSPKKNFNYRLSRARRFVECSFGILVNKWRILHRAINVEPDFGIDIVKACVVLHNFIRNINGLPIEETSVEATTNISTLDDLPPERETRGGRSTNHTRQIFSEYFEGVGTVPWKLLKI